MDEQPWVVMPDSLLSAALREVDPIPPRDQGYLPRLADNRATSDVPRSLILAIIEYLSEDLMCDHSVNICMCSAKGIVEELRLALDGKLTCTDCGGDGQVWSRERYRIETVRLAQHHGVSVEEVRSWGEGPGYKDCERCEGAGVIRMESVAV